MYTIVDNLGLAALAGMMDACSDRSGAQHCAGCPAFTACRKLWARACLAAASGQFQGCAVTASLREFRELMEKESCGPGLGLVPLLLVEPGSAENPDDPAGFVS